MLRLTEHPFTPDTNAKEGVTFLDGFPTEYSGHGVGDYRESCVRVRDMQGHNAVQLTYVSHEINGTIGAIFSPMHKQPVYAGAPVYTNGV